MKQSWIKRGQKYLFKEKLVKKNKKHSNNNSTLKESVSFKIKNIFVIGFHLGIIGYLKGIWINQFGFLEGRINTFHDVQKRKNQPLDCCILVSCLHKYYIHTINNVNDIIDSIPFWYIQIKTKQQQQQQV